MAVSGIRSFPRQGKSTLEQEGNDFRGIESFKKHKHRVFFADRPQKHPHVARKVHPCGKPFAFDLMEGTSKSTTNSQG